MKRGKGETQGRETGSAPVYVTPLFTVSLSACTSRGFGSHSSAEATHAQTLTPQRVHPTRRGTHISRNNSHNVNLLSHLLMVPGIAFWSRLSSLKASKWSPNAHYGENLLSPYLLLPVVFNASGSSWEKTTTTLHRLRDSATALNNSCSLRLSQTVLILSLRPLHFTQPLCVLKGAEWIIPLWE